jgi:serine/threonine kinase 16
MCNNFYHLRQALAIIDESAQFCTMPYRAPELFEPTRGVNLDCRTDVWSVGCLLFAWWFGYSPFECEFTASESKSCKYRVKLAECSFSRVLARIPRPSGKEVNIDDNIVCDLVEWILEKNISTRPFMSDVISRIEETIGNMQDSNNAL